MYIKASIETNQNEHKENDYANELRNILQIERSIKLIVFGMLIGCIVAALYSSQASNWAQFLSIVSIALLIASSFSLLGGLLGFLFGIPQTLQENRPTSCAK